MPTAGYSPNQIHIVEGNTKITFVFPTGKKNKDYALMIQNEYCEKFASNIVVNMKTSIHIVNYVYKTHITLTKNTIHNILYKTGLKKVNIF